MFHPVDIQAFNELRSEIQSEMDNYTSDLECVGTWDVFIGHRERFRTLKEVLGIMDEIQKRLSE